MSRYTPVTKPGTGHVPKAALEIALCRGSFTPATASSQSRDVTGYQTWPAGTCLEGTWRPKVAL